MSCLTCPSSMTAATGARPSQRSAWRQRKIRKKAGEIRSREGAEAPASREVWEGRPAWHPKPDPEASASPRATDLFLAVHLWGHNTVSPRTDEAAQVANPALPSAQAWTLCCRPQGCMWVAGWTTGVQQAPELGRSHCRVRASRAGPGDGSEPVGRDRAVGTRGPRADRNRSPSQAAP